MEAAAIVARGAPGAETLESRAAYMRYLGQGHEVVVPLPNRAWAPGDTGIIRGAFEATYEALYGRIISKLDLEIVSWSVQVSTVPEDVARVDPHRCRRRRRWRGARGRCSIPAAATWSRRRSTNAATSAPAPAWTGLRSSSRPIPRRW